MVNGELRINSALNVTYELAKPPPFLRTSFSQNKIESFFIPRTQI